MSLFDLFRHKEEVHHVAKDIAEVKHTKAKLPCKYPINQYGADCKFSAYHCDTCSNKFKYFQSLKNNVNKSE